MILCNELVSNNEDEKEKKSTCVHIREAIVAIETVKKSVQKWSSGGVHVWEMHFQQKSLCGTETLFKIGDVHLREMFGNRDFIVVYFHQMEQE